MTHAIEFPTMFVPSQKNVNKNVLSGDRQNYIARLDTELRRAESVFEFKRVFATSSAADLKMIRSHPELKQKIDANGTRRKLSSTDFTWKVEYDDALNKLTSFSGESEDLQHTGSKGRTRVKK